MGKTSGLAQLAIFAWGAEERSKKQIVRTTTTTTKTDVNDNCKLDKSQDTYVSYGVALCKAGAVVVQKYVYVYV